MSKSVKFDASSVKTPSTPIQKPNFAADVVDVNISLPVNQPSKKIKFDVLLNRDINGFNLCTYDLDYLPNVDINQYLQYVVNLYNNGFTSYPLKSTESSSEM